MQDEGHTVSTEFFIRLVPTRFKGQMCCLIRHDKDVFCKGEQLLWLVLSGGPVLPKWQRQCHLNCGNVLSFYIRVCVQSGAGGGGGREARTAGWWCWLRVISGVSPSETSRCWTVINSTRKLLSQGKSISAPKSGFNLITLLLICSIFTSKELRYYPGSPISLFYISKGDFVSLALTVFQFRASKRKARRQNMPLC